MKYEFKYDDPCWIWLYTLGYNLRIAALYMMIDDTNTDFIETTGWGA